MSISLPPRRPSRSQEPRPETSSGKVVIKDLKDLITELTQEQTKIQELLSFLGFALRSYSNLNQFLELIPLIATRVTDADGGALILFKSSGEMYLESLHCIDDPAVMRPQQVRSAIDRATQQASSGSAAALDDMISRFLGGDVKLFGTAIIVKNAVRGRLYVFSHKPNYAWGENRQKLMRLVADQTAVGLENNALAAELLKKERQDRELEIGAEIQRQLLPRNCPAIAGVELAAKCLTANRVGGDYYDFIPVKKGDRWSLVIADVMGKGVPAGLIMTMTRGMLRAEVLNGHSPGRILEHLNQVMYDDLEKSNRFVTMFYSEYDPESRMLAYSNAAHTPALLWRSQTNTVHALDTLGSLIGLEAGSKYEEAKIMLEPGDVVLYYTDGLTEAANQEGDRFDEENLRASMQYACEKAMSPSPQQDRSSTIRDHIFESVQKFIGNSHGHNDDMTLLVLCIKEISG
ncbi:protein serine/threonine phosphatase with GAF(s) sensor(s) [Thalassoporum mexicanum PCC 7367]|uniref:PP2C family protein-serine/threonine phosphatase n=1 Tax=Thalassoporum mexicanum TaxID=3457544 RepID=UPI00029FBACC|nr:PP2C family protein-serine/threonine phosphatase [Pseudanabaena sp. PCC 7367]AFY68410.1 protein serine/threonine phosphatase with GAF(s) sensor(s) [Pseudanabaena sp. PCC 7367]